jgi:hypothetical protein
MGMKIRFWGSILRRNPQFVGLLIVYLFILCTVFG